jgi:hypothetical protein
MTLWTVFGSSPHRSNPSPPSMKFPEQYRLHNPPSASMRTNTGDPYGMFIVPSGHAPGGRSLKIIACRDFEETKGWQHVSVSLVQLPDVTPRWDTMCFVKDLFWEPEQVVVQFHPPKSEHVNTHNGCLHLWHHQDMITPPKELV